MSRILALAGMLFLAVGLGSLRAEESDARALLASAQIAANRNDSERAVDLATRAIEKNASLAGAYYLRGRERFRLAQFDASLSDFDQYVDLVPGAASRQWERGIACYYAKQYKKGAEQFKLYQTYHDNDVENSVWRYLCMVPTEGIEKSRKTILQIRNDRRVPMMEVFELYRGKLKPQDVLDACQHGDPSEIELAGRLFYAHLYLGLFHEVASQQDLARKYIKLAAQKQLADNPHINRYMWDVARIHADMMQKDLQSKDEEE